MRLRTSLSVVLTHILVVSSTEANSRLLTFVTDVNADKHSLFTDLRSEGHSPQVTAKLSVHLSNDIEEDTVVVLSNSAIGHKLRDNRRITVDLVFDERVEVLVIRMVRHNHQEDELGVECIKNVLFLHK